MSAITKFQEESPSLESYWRSIILFGRNVASYKFALSKSLLEIAPTGKTIIRLDELAEPFSWHICQHLVNNPKQGTSHSSQFLDACRDFNEGKLTKEQLLDITVEKGFNNVIDAFHVVNEGIIPVVFYEKDYTRNSKKIVLTDDIFKLQDLVYYDDLVDETESRWNLVETAWELGVSRNLLNIEYDDDEKLLVVGQDKFRRKDVTSARAALNGFQKGRCSYCFDDITVNGGDDLLCDVDHFFPHIMQTVMPHINLDGVWNLVLSCQICNRGPKGKFSKVPHPRYLEKLHNRNEYLISSHHPLRETLMNQTGAEESDRIFF